MARPIKNKPDQIPDSLLTALIIHIYIGWGFLYLLKVAVIHLTYNAYIGLIPATLVILAISWIVYDLARLFPNRSISEICILVYNKLLGKIIAAIIMFFLFSFVVVALRDAQLMVHTYFFQETPLILFTGVLMSAVLYIALSGVQSLGRLAAFLLFPPLVLILALTLLGLKNIEPANVLPVMAGSPLNWLRSGLDLTFALLPGAGIVFYLPYLKQPQSIKKISFSALGVVLPLFFLALFGTVGVFGSTMVKKISWSVVEYYHVIDYPYMLLEQAGLFFLIAWYPFVFVSISYSLSIMGNELHYMFPGIRRNWYILIMVLPVFAVVNIPVNIVFLQALIKQYQTLVPLTFMGIIMLTWAVARLRLTAKR